MTEKEEIKYLMGLLQAAACWRLSEGDDRSPVDLEIDSRLNALLGEPDEVVDGRVINKKSSTYPQDVDNPEPAGMVQISMPKKKKKWVRLDWTELVPCKCSHTGFKRVVKEEFRHLVPGMEPVPDVDAAVAG